MLIALVCLLHIISRHACHAELSSQQASVNKIAEGNNSSLKDVVFAYGLVGLSKWELFSKACNGKAQSPINVDTTSTARVRQPHIFWWNYHRRPVKMTLANNGHTVLLTGKWDQIEHTPYHFHGSGGDIKSYALDSIHFHWGAAEREGSEHRLNSVGFAMEMHAVHYSKEFSSLAEALLRGRGVRVIAVFFMLSESRNQALDEIVRWLPSIRRPTVIAIEPFEIGKLLIRFSQAFITYNGSLTTPPCTEAVSWIIRLSPSTISIEQLEEFRKIIGHTDESLRSNVRPVQPVNGRSIVHVS